MGQPRTSRDSNAGYGRGGVATIGRSAKVRGRVTGEGDLVVEGTVEGDVTIGGEVTLSSGGVLEGDVDARGAVRILSGARVRGSVKSDEVILEEGAEFSGELTADFDLPRELLEIGDHAAAAPARRR